MRGKILGVLAIAVSLSLVAPPVLAQVAGSDQATDEARFVELINAERTKLGLPALRVVPELTAVGRQWSVEMMARDSGSENCAVVHNPGFVAKVTASWQRLGENVGCGNVDIATLHARFVSSPAHYRNIVDPSFDSIGVGVAYDGDVLFVTQQFMDLRDAPSVSVPSELANQTPPRKATTRLTARKVKR
jgi:uncharacterized protein YkwD